MKTFLLRVAYKLLLLAVDRALARALPKIYKTLDEEMPHWLKTRVSPVQVEDRIRGIVNNAIKGNATDEQMKLVRLFYDPIAAVSNHFINPRRPDLPIWQ